MRDGLVPAWGGSPNFGDSQAAATLGVVSGAARPSPRRGTGLARLAGRAGAGTAEGEGGGEGQPSSLCQAKRLRPAAKVFGRAAAGPEARRAGGRAQGEAGGGAGRTWQRPDAACGCPGPRGVEGGLKGFPSFLMRKLLNE